jgi:glycosyltransferase involved in cell wall biosynthesis
MPAASELTVSVIVPVYNGGEAFRQCLASLAAVAPRPLEVIVVADGDTDGSWRVGREFVARVLRLSERGGPARARNLGARRARGDILLFLDADVTVPPDLIARVTAAFRQEPGLDALFGSYDDDPAATNFLSQYKNLFHHHLYQTGREEATTFWTACGAIRREVFAALGGFDESYRWSQDIELGYRLTRTGRRIRLCKDLQVKHLKRWDLLSLLRSDVVHHALPWTGLILRDRLLVDDLNLSLSSRVSVALASGLVGALVGAWWQPLLLAPAAGLVVALLWLNAPLYRFFLRQRGVRFTAQVIPWHWLYYLYSGLGFAVGVARYALRRPGTSRRRGSVAPEVPGPGGGRPLLERRRHPDDF